MKEKKYTNLKSILWIIAAVALVLAVSPVPALSVDIECAFEQAQCNSPGDGLEESSDLVLPGQTFTMCSPQLPSYDPDRAVCLDPGSKDLFVILIAVSPLLQTIEDPLEFISKSTPDLGLGIAIHPIDENQAFAGGIDRAVVNTPSVQKAVRIRESSDTAATEPLGAASEGTPNMQDDATIFTKRIESHVNSICGQATQAQGCWDNTVRIYPPYTDFITKYIKHTLAHETAHMLALKKDEDRRIGRHYPTGTNVILDQQVYYKISKGKVTWYLGVDFTPDDIANARLK